MKRLVFLIWAAGAGGMLGAFGAVGLKLANWAPPSSLGSLVWLVILVGSALVGIGIRLAITPQPAGSANLGAPSPVPIRTSA